MWSYYSYFEYSKHTSFKFNIRFRKSLLYKYINFHRDIYYSKYNSLIHNYLFTLVRYKSIYYYFYIY